MDVASAVCPLGASVDWGIVKAWLEWLVARVAIFELVFNPMKVESIEVVAAVEAEVTLECMVWGVPAIAAGARGGGALP